MYRHKVLITALFVCLAVSASNAAGIIYVEANSPNNPGIGTSEDPFRRIQDAINYAVSGDILEIRRGIYSGYGNYELDPNGKSITICSSDPNAPNIVAQTIIDPEQAGRGFYIHTGEDSNCIISGLTIRNTYAEASYNGAGIYCYGSSPTIRNCVIKNGHAESSGGGICFDYGSATVINCNIMDNTADYYGGGIGFNFSSPVLIGCTVSGNTAGRSGGGIDSGQSDPNIINCVIINNYAPYGGGINCYYPGVANVVNCTIADNLAEYVGGGVYCQYEGSANIKNSILWANAQQLGMEYEGSASVTYCDVQGGQTDVYDPCGLLVWGQGNIDIDPCFASFNLDEDPNWWDFHLTSRDGRWVPDAYPAEDITQDGFVDLRDFAAVAASWLQQGENLSGDLDNSNTVDLFDLKIVSDAYLTAQPKEIWVYDGVSSPCLDAGDPNSDWSAETWPNGKRINMGAYGGTAQASKSGNIADFNIDGKVNFIDFAELGKMWGEDKQTIEDLTGDGIVDIGDLDILAENWLWEK